MSQFIDVISDQGAQELLGGSGCYPPIYPPSYPCYQAPKCDWSVTQTVYAPISSAAVSSSSATAFNIGVKNILSPQTSSATAVSGATSTVIGGTVSA